MEYANKTEKIEWEHNIFKGIVTGDLNYCNKRWQILSGDDNSYVSGSMNHGIFEGVIETSNGEEFWVSLCWKLLKSFEIFQIESSYPYNSTSSFHSFIYSANDVEMPKPADRSKRFFAIFLSFLHTTCRGNSFYDRRFRDNDRDGDQLYSPYKTEHSRQPEPPKRNTVNKRRPYQICEDEVRGKVR